MSQCPEPPCNTPSGMQKNLNSFSCQDDITSVIGNPFLAILTTIRQPTKSRNVAPHSRYSINCEIAFRQGHNLGDDLELRKKITPTRQPFSLRTVVVLRDCGHDGFLADVAGFDRNIFPIRELLMPCSILLL